MAKHPTEKPVAPKPSIGRIVHFVTHGGPGAPPEHRAAIIAGVRSGGAVMLNVFGPSGVSVERLVEHDEGHTMATWHWPERD